MVGGALGAALALAAQVAFPTIADAPGSPRVRLPRVTAAASPLRSEFADSEQVFARYLISLPDMANDIVDDDPTTYGFMGGGWWRPTGADDPRNSRVMEHVATLAWFYSTPRPWNAYAGNPALLARLEAAIRYYTALQRPDGSYPVANEDSSLAATAFGLVAQADTYELLLGTGVSEDTMDRLGRSIAAATAWVMNEESPHWQVPILVFNQVAGALVGAQRALQIAAADVTQETIDQRVSFLCANGQAPAGFFHESKGPDFGYNFTVAMPDLAWLFQQTQNQDIPKLVQRYVDFMQLALIPEPQGNSFTHVAALHARNILGALERPADDLRDRSALATAFLELVPGIAFLLPTQEEKSEARTAFALSAQPIGGLSKPDTSPRTWMYGPLAASGPTAQQRASVESALPMRARERFTKLAFGSWSDEYLFVRRPSYYFAGAFGERFDGELSTRQLGTLWSPTIGTILFSSNRRDGTGWATAAVDGTFSTRRSSSESQYFSDSVTNESRPLLRTDVSDADGVFAQRSESRAAPTAWATGWGFWDQGLRFSFSAAGTGPFIHELPFVLKPGDVLAFSDGTALAAGGPDRTLRTSYLTLTRGGDSVLFSLGEQPLLTTITATEIAAAGGTVHTVTITFEEQLGVHLAFLKADGSLTAEAHALPDGEIAMRVVAAGEIARKMTSLRVAETKAAFDVGSIGSDFTVVEQRLTAPQTPTTKITIEGLDARGAVLGSFSAQIR